MCTQYWLLRYHKAVAAKRERKPGRRGRPLPVTLILLAGGESRRMKRDKARLPVGDQPLIKRLLDQVEGFFGEILISVSKGQAYEFLGHRHVEDEIEGRGPLAGILSGLRAAANEICVVMACDIPDIDLNFLARLIDEARGFEIVVPRSEEGKSEPLLAVYRKSLIPRIEKLLESPSSQVLALFEISRTRFLPADELAWLRNLNTPQEYEDYLRSLK